MIIPPAPDSSSITSTSERGIVAIKTLQTSTQSLEDGDILTYNRTARRCTSDQNQITMDFEMSNSNQIYLFSFTRGCTERKASITRNLRRTTFTKMFETSLEHKGNISFFTAYTSNAIKCVSIDKFMVKFRCSFRISSILYGNCFRVTRCVFLPASFCQM